MLKARGDKHIILLMTSSVLDALFHLLAKEGNVTIITKAASHY